MVNEIINEEVLPTQEDIQYYKKRWKKKVNKLCWSLFWFQLTIQVAGAIVSVALYYASGLSFIPQELLQWLITDAVIYLIGFPIFFMIIKDLPVYSFQNKKHLLSITKILLYWVLCLGILYSFNLIGSSISLFITHFTGGNPNPIETIMGSPIYTIIFGCIIPAIMEEIVFRKLLISKIYPLGDTFCILLSGILFGFFHGNLAQIAYAIPLGCFLAYVYIQTNDIRNPMILHFLTNLCGTLVFPYLVTKSLPLGLALMAILIAFTIYYFLRNKRNFALQRGELALSEKQKRGLLFKAPGFIAYTILTLLLVIIMLFATALI